MISDLPHPAPDDRLARFAHELRTPLHALLGMTELLRATPLDAQGRDYAATIEEAARALVGLVDEAMRGPDSAAPRTCAVRDVVDSVVRLLAPQATAKGLALRADVQAGVPAVVAVHAGRLRQLLVNLVGNAVKYTADGGVAVRVDVAPSAAGLSPRLRVEVEDTGPGIAPELRERVFAAWVRGEGVRAHDGVGLGLALCREMARDLGGHVDVRESTSGGCIFTLVAPAPPVVALDAPASAAPPASGPRRAARVLLVEDDAVGRHVVARMLDRLGATVVVVDGGTDALDALERTRLGDPPFDVVLLDCRLADGDGADVAAAWRARERETDGRRVPIVAITGDATAATVARCRAAGMDGHLVKPASLDTLARLLEAVCAAHAALASDDAPPSHAWDDALLDVGAFARLLRLGEDATFAPALVDAWATDAERRVLTIAAAHAVGDAPAVARAAHALKGSSANVGAAAVAARAAVVQRAADVGELAAVAAEVASLAPCVADTRRALRAAVARAIRSRTPRVSFPLVGGPR